jgi:hypothetical protein
VGSNVPLYVSLTVEALSTVTSVAAVGYVRQPVPSGPTGPESSDSHDDDTMIVAINVVHTAARAIPDITRRQFYLTAWSRS